MGLLDQVFGGGAVAGAGQSGMSPITMALLGLLAYRTVEGKGRLAEMLGRAPSGGVAGSSAQAGSSPVSPAPSGGGIGGLLSGLLGGGGATAAGGLLSTGLRDLVNRFQQNGQGDKAQSWVGSGANQSITPAELEQGLGSDRISWLMQETGMSRDELLKGLSRELPGTVDKLTPQGRLPTEHEATKMI